MNDWNRIAEDIGQATGHEFAPNPPRALGGGCINHAQRLSDGTHTYFVKTNSADRLDMFEAEFAGLQALAATKAIRLPKPICCGVADTLAYLAMEFLDLSGSGKAQLAGEQLAALHGHQESRFGWYRDNTIGATRQPNGWLEDWIEFWRERRLGFQLRLAANGGQGGALQRRGERLLEEFPALIDHNPRPSLLHGDLWGGNIAYLRDGEPVLFDPAVYYGDAEAELAMTELFGGFDHRFYNAYASVRPLDPGYKTRRTLYNLYHILNHLNLFGGGYASQALGMIDRLLAELGH